MSFDESLLTAYLDGELTPQERAFVEQQLANHQEHRETLRELAELQKKLAALPQETFSTDVVADVQRRIRAQRAEGLAAGDPFNAGNEHAAGERLPEAHLPRMQQTRPAWHLWLPLALAASGLAVITLASLRQSDEVAVLDRSTEDQAEPFAMAADDPETQKPESDSLEFQRLDFGTQKSFAPDAQPSPSPASAAPASAAPALKMDKSASSRPNAQAMRIERFSGEGAEGLGGAAAEQGAPSDRAAGEIFDRGRPVAPESLFATTPLPAGTRVYRLSEAAGQTHLGILGETLDRPAMRKAAEAAENAVKEEDESAEWFARFANAPRIVYEVPPGEIGSILQWIGERHGGTAQKTAAPEPNVAEPRSLSAREPENGLEDRTPPESEPPVALLVHAPTGRLPGLLQSLDERIGESRGQLAEVEAGSSDGEAIIVLVPTAPQP